MLEVTETLYNTLKIDSDTILEYFEQMEEDDSPTIDDLMTYVLNNYYISDFVCDENSAYTGDEDILKEMYLEYKNIEND